MSQTVPLKVRRKLIVYFHISLPHKQQPADLIKERPFTQEPDLSCAKTGREYLAAMEEYMVSLFLEGYAVRSLLDFRTFYTDRLLQLLCKKFRLDEINRLCMAAVGGYGRAELFLKSDVDILILSEKELSDTDKDKISDFISFLWDLKLDIGSSVRTIEETLETAGNDLTVRTNLLETRLLFGDEHVYNELFRSLSENDSWSARSFFHAKVAEELERHHAYKDTAYALEPDLKNNPGGLRDLQVMQWIANFHFNAKTPEDMLKLNFLSMEEYEELKECTDALFQVRYALHTANRSEDNRLLLDHQPTVAGILGYTGEGNEPVENMMRDLFRTLRRVRELNSMVLQMEVLRITGNIGSDEIQFLGNGFVRKGPLIDLCEGESFMTNRSKMLEIFIVMSKHPEIAGLHVNCIRKLRTARRSLNGYLVEIPECRKLFKKLLENPAASFSALPLMHEHHLLSAYMSLWEKIEGLSQFDMFHTFTVDEHSVRVIKNIEYLSKSKEPIHSLFANVYRQLSSPEVLITAALLHDIAKGRGGHHAQLGAGDALYFCQLHKYPLYQTRLISWLVFNHLQFSYIALRRDINDPQVVNEFSKLVQDEEHLNLLYCLSVADINATNDKEWNSWKDQVFRQLYFSTRQALRHGLEMPQDTRLHAGENQQMALSYLKDMSESEIKAYWSSFKTEYFICYTPHELAWHIRNILNHRSNDKPLILFAQHGEMGTEMLLFSRVGQKTFSFGNIATVMARKNLNIQSAQFITNKLNHSLCTIKFQNRMGGNIDNDRLHSVRKAVLDGLLREASLEGIKTENPQSRIFKVPTVINFMHDIQQSECTNLEISTLDRPGLLACIGIVFGRLNIKVKSARITTTGERADDFFSVTDKQGRALSDRQKDRLSRALYEVLDFVGKSR